MSSGVPLKKTSDEVESAVASWIAEEREFCLHMSTHVGREVSAWIERRLVDDPFIRLKEQVTKLVETNTLRSSMRITDCASDMEICADLARRSISYSMSLRAPGDRKSTKARVNWVLRMLPKDDDRLMLRAHWPGRGSATMKSVRSLRQDPLALQPDNQEFVPHSFEVLLVESNAKRFSGRRTFVEALEENALAFYDLVGVHLKCWQAAPPKPVRLHDDPAPGEIEQSDLGPAGATPAAE